MAVTLSAVDELAYFVRDVIIRADHHAQSLTTVTMTLAGAILWKKDTDTEIRVRRNGMWCTIGGVRYCFAYVQGGGGKIELRVGSQQGDVRYVFTNKTTPAEIAGVFEDMKMNPTWEDYLEEGNEE